MNRSWCIAAALAVVLAAGRAGQGRAPASQFEAVGTVEILPRHYQVVNEVLLARGADLSEAERREVSVAIAEESAKAGYDPFLILGLIDVESDFRRNAVSSADARGLMQIQPVTLEYLIVREQWPMHAADVGKDPSLCVRLGVRYLRQLHDRFHSLNAALMAYNMGPTKFAALSKIAHGLDGYWGYVKAVKRDATALKARHGSDAAGASVAIGADGAKPVILADGIRGG